MTAYADWYTTTEAALWSPPAVGCSVLIAGAPVADGRPGGPDDTHPTVLDGLAVTWGRETTLDQPQPASCGFTIMDTSGAAWGDLARVGAAVQVTAAGTAFGPASVETVTDGGFQTLPAGPAGGRVTAGPGTTVTVDAADPADHYLWCTGKAGVSVTIPPAPPVPASDPTGWDGIPRTAAGQTWTATVQVTAAPGGVPPRVRLVGYTKPWLPPTAVAATWTGPDAGGVYRCTAHPPGGLWLGVTVDSTEAGYRWNTIPDTITWDTAPAGWTWDRMWGFSVDDVSILSPPGGVARTVLVFAGRITDSVATFDPVAGATMITVTAADLLADLANRDVGAQPWPAESLQARAVRILTASGVPGVTLVVAPGPAAQQVSRMDVDRQQVAPLLADLAASVDAVLWCADHLTQGGYLWIEDPATRTPAQQLALGDDGVVRIVPAAGAGVTELSACRADLEPATWRQTVSDIATRITVTWKDQTTTPDVTDRTYSLTNPALESPALPYGVRKISLDSLVTSSAAADTVGRQILARLSDPTWRLSGLTWPLTDPDLTADDITHALDLLDGTTRVGRPVRITDLPWWAPVNPTTAVFTEGGRYTFTGGTWTLELLVSAAQALGRSVRWDELPAGWSWDMFDPAISWNDMLGVGPPSTVTVGR